MEIPAQGPVRIEPGFKSERRALLRRREQFKLVNVYKLELLRLLPSLSRPELGPGASVLLRAARPVYSPPPRVEQTQVVLQLYPVPLPQFPR